MLVINPQTWNFIYPQVKERINRILIQILIDGDIRQNFFGDPYKV